MTPSTIARLYFAIGFSFGCFFMYIVGQVARWRAEIKKAKEQSTNDGR